MAQKDKKSDVYDIVIVGAGISGFYIGLELLRWRSRLRIAIADRYKFLGGRTFTFQADISGEHYQWEEGAARISRDHLNTLDLVRKYNLTPVPISGDLQFLDLPGKLEPDNFSRAIPILLEPLAKLPRDRLAQTTLKKLLGEIHGRPAAEEFLIRYPYRAELDTMRADMALDLFAHEFRTFEGYVYLKEGFSALIEAMRKDFEARGGVVLPQHECVSLAPTETVFLKGAPSEGPAREEVRLRSRATVLAIPSEAVKRLQIAKRLPWLSHLAMRPLLRIYSVFPKETAWLKTLPKMVTPLPNRFIIPSGGPAVQISYTDSQDAEFLMDALKEKGEAAVGQALTGGLGLKEKPLFTKAHKWPEGVTYWLPGDYDPAAISRLAAWPLPKEFPGLFLAGESYSLRQCWVEGALEHSDVVLQYIKQNMDRL